MVESLFGGRTRVRAVGLSNLCCGVIGSGRVEVIPITGRFFCVLAASLDFCNSSARKAADLDLRFKVKCLLGAGTEPAVAAKAFLFKYRHSRGRMDLSECLRTILRNSATKSVKTVALCDMSKLICCFSGYFDNNSATIEIH